MHKTSHSECEYSVYLYSLNMLTLVYTESCTTIYW